MIQKNIFGKNNVEIKRKAEKMTKKRKARENKEPKKKGKINGGKKNN